MYDFGDQECSLYQLVVGNLKLGVYGERWSWFSGTFMQQLWLLLNYYNGFSIEWKVRVEHNDASMIENIYGNHFCRNFLVYSIQINNWCLNFSLQNRSLGKIECHNLIVKRSFVNIIKALRCISNIYNCLTSKFYRRNLRVTQIQSGHEGETKGRENFSFSNFSACFNCCLCLSCH